MKRPRWRAAAAFEDSQAQFRDAAHTMIRAGSLANLSMRTLAIQVGASAMTAYRYYPDKDALIADVRRQVWREFIAQLISSVDGITDARAILRTMALTYLSYADEHKYEYRLIFDGPRPEEDPRASAEPLDAQAWTLLRDLIARITADEDDGRLSHKAHLIWSTLHGLATLHHSGRLSLEGRIDEVGPPVVELLLDALGAEA